MPDKARILDVSQMEPPQPLQVALAALDTLAPGEYLCLLHRREPVLLYPLLEQRGYAHITCGGSNADDRGIAFRIYIWRLNDACAEAAARRAADPLF